MTSTYTLDALIGAGMLSRVYRATHARGRSRRSVALKILRDDVPDEVVGRLRDEARILSALQDPAFVRADPPLLLEGRWVVAMEFVPGETAFRLLRHGPYPPRAALRIVGEVARALATAWDAPGPTGAPLRLLHRDLKPGNLQITPEGRVRVLDLGIARAALPSRESRTGALVPGTAGYIAPERKRGIEGIEAEVWSLGTVLRVLATGEQPTRPDGFRDEMSGLDEVVRLAGRMLEPDPAARLAMADVAREAVELADALPGADLADWARAHVRTVEGRDPLCGQVWRDHTDTHPLRRWLGGLLRW